MFFKSKKFPYILLGIMIFVFMFIFFTVIHPLVVFDVDDWTYISAARKFIPVIHAWNPARVFPEVFMPLCGSLAAYLIYPLIGDYLGSFTIVFSLVVSLVISLYIYAFSKMITKVFSLKTISAILLSILFFLFHFLLFVSSSNNNQYMFLCHDVTCYFYYLIPNLLNFIIIFNFISKKNMDYSLSFANPLKLGVFLLILYVAIFSNLYCSIILAVYAGSELLIGFFKEIKGKFSIMNFIKKYFLLLAIIASFLISLAFELTGGRANFAESGSFIVLLKTTLENFGKSMLSLNKNILLLFILITFSFLITLIVDIFKNKYNKKYLELFLKIVICSIVIGVYLLLLSSKVNPSYVLSIEYVYGFWCYILILEFLGFIYLIKRYNKIVVILPFLIVFFLVEFNSSIASFKESNTKNYNSVLCKEIGNDFINQIKEAEKLGQTTVHLLVPDYGIGDNWPYPEYFNERIAYTLYKHRITKKKVNIKIIIDNEYNKKFNL